MLCVWWNFEGIFHHFELFQNNALNAASYSEQLDCVCAAFAARYPVLINRKHPKDMNDEDSSQNCQICNEKSSRMHYCALTYRACRDFFQRLVLSGHLPECVGNNNCDISKDINRNYFYRNSFDWCIQIGRDPRRMFNFSLQFENKSRVNGRLITH